MRGPSTTRRPDGGPCPVKSSQTARAGESDGPPDDAPGRVRRNGARAATVDRMLDTYLSRGWCPVPWSHQPEVIKSAIRNARCRPKIKGCFENSQRVALFGQEPSISYCEGFVLVPGREVPLPLEHAWVMVDGEHYDLTITDVCPSPIAWWTVSNEEVFRQVSETMEYGPIKQPLFKACLPVAWRAIGVELFKEIT